VKRKGKTFFAVTSLGRDRWYWVVWPSLELLRSAEVPARHVADGYERTKAGAVERALEVAGMDGEWLAAKYAKQYHRQLSRERRAKARGQGDGAAAAPAAQEFLYRDVRDGATGRWYSVPHRVARRTKKYVFVEQRRYEPERLTGTWLDRDAPTFRLSREALEREGYAFVPVTADVEDPLFFAVPYRERAAQYVHLSPACFDLLNLSFPCSIAEVKVAYRELAKRVHPDRGGSHDEFLALQAAYEEALRLCRYL
jgi:hypothetical protein